MHQGPAHRSDTRRAALCDETLLEALSLMYTAWPQCKTYVGLASRVGIERLGITSVVRNIVPIGRI